MSKNLVPIVGIATLLFSTSCAGDSGDIFLKGEDTGTTTEVFDSNEDEDVNPSHIRGYGNREPGMRGSAAPTPYQYYAFSTTGLPSVVRNELEGNVAVEMVMVYYKPGLQLSDLAEKYNRPGAVEVSMPPEAPDAAIAHPGGIAPGADTTNSADGEIEEN